MVAVRLAGVARSGGDGVLGGYSRSDGEHDGGNLHLGSEIDYAGRKGDRR